MMLRIIKIGGSLLSCDDIFQRVRLWADRQPPADNVWLVGGGTLVEGLREMHQRFQLDERTSHWLAVDLLEVTTGIFAHRFPEWISCNDAALLRGLTHLTCSERRVSGTTQARNFLFSSGPWLRTQRHVPESWDVTTDSIAALIAHELAAEECVLLKSTLPSHGPLPDIAELAEQGYCDPFFPTAAAKLPLVRVVNLRDDSFQENQFTHNCAQL